MVCASRQLRLRQVSRGRPAWQVRGNVIPERVDYAAFARYAAFAWARLLEPTDEDLGKRTLASFQRHLALSTVPLGMPGVALACSITLRYGKVLSSKDYIWSRRRTAGRQKGATRTHAKRQKMRSQSVDFPLSMLI